MANNYFQFKQFTVYQDRSTLKVSTDSCVFGAWVSRQLMAFEAEVSRCLDIGAGTGLLMLMLAQGFPGTIEGIEIDRDSFEQASENINASPWYDRLHLSNEDAKLFSRPHRFDLIISNPPFFEGDLKAETGKRNLAKHAEALSFADLLEAADANLADCGRLAVLLPFRRSEYFESLAAGYGLYVSARLQLRQSPAHPFFRSLLLLQRDFNGEINRESLSIYGSDKQYSSGFIALLRDYYLYL